MIVLQPILKIAGQIALAFAVTYATEYAQARARERLADEKRKRELADNALESAQRAAIEEATRLTRH